MRGEWVEGWKREGKRSKEKMNRSGGTCHSRKSNHKMWNGESVMTYFQKWLKILKFGQVGHALTDQMSCEKIFNRFPQSNSSQTFQLPLGQREDMCMHRQKYFQLFQMSSQQNAALLPRRGVWECFSVERWEITEGQRKMNGKEPTKQRLRWFHESVDVWMLRKYLWAFELMRMRSWICMHMEILTFNNTVAFSTRWKFITR